MLYLLFLIIRAFGELRNMPYFGVYDLFVFVMKYQEVLFRCSVEIYNDFNALCGINFDYYYNTSIWFGNY